MSNKQQNMVRRTKSTHF